MPYTRRLVCVANSVKNGGTCVGGREFTRAALGPWIRPVSSRPAGELSLIEHCFADFSEPALLDVIDIPLLRPSPHLHQTENHLIDSSLSWTRAGRIPFHRVGGLVETPATLWTNSLNSGSGRFNCIPEEEQSLIPALFTLCRSLTFASASRRTEADAAAPQANLRWANIVTNSALPIRSSAIAWVI